LSPSILFWGTPHFEDNYMKPTNTCSVTLECLSTTTRELTNFVVDTFFEKASTSLVIRHKSRTPQNTHMEYTMKPHKINVSHASKLGNARTGTRI